MAVSSTDGTLLSSNEGRSAVSSPEEEEYDEAVSTLPSPLPLRSPTAAAPKDRGAEEGTPETPKGPKRKLPAP